MNNTGLIISLSADFLKKAWGFTESDALRMGEWAVEVVGDGRRQAVRDLIESTTLGDGERVCRELDVEPPEIDADPEVRWSAVWACLNELTEGCLPGRWI